MVRLIAAIDSKRGLATDAGIPWLGKLPTDTKFFRDQIAEGTILMAAGTYRELSKPLHGRTNYVVTHRTEPLRPGFEAVSDIAVFFQKNADGIVQDIGGASLYEQTLQYADELVLTQLDGDYGCTKFFPDYTQDFELTSESEPIRENGIIFRFTTWRRKAN